MAAYLVVDSVTRRLYEVFNGGATREDVKKTAYTPLQAALIANSPLTRNT
jgi:glutamine amidotransferase-like uncharacterized protein